MTKKISLCIAALLAVVVFRGTILARITGTTVNPETCWGADGAEACVDSSGNVIPTTNNDASLGTSSLRFSNIFSVLGNFSGAITGTSLTLTTGLGTASIADGAVTSDKLGSLAVETAKVQNSAVTSDKIASGAITNGKLGADSVTSDKILADSIGTSEIINSAITSPKLASTAVTSGKVAGMNSASPSSGKVACWKDNGEGGYCAQLSSINSTGCDLCY